MMRRAFVTTMLLMLPALAGADHPFETFRDGILGIPWGATLDDVVATYPNGDHVFATTPGHRAFWVKDGQTFLGIPRERNGVLYGMDENNRLAIVAVAFEYERRVQLNQTLSALFGLPQAGVSGAKDVTYGWRRKESVVHVKEFGTPHQRIIWLVVTAPGYTSEREGCPTACSAGRSTR